VLQVHTWANSTRYTRSFEITVLRSYLELAWFSRRLRPLYIASQGQAWTQIKHFYWCNQWNQPQGLYIRSKSEIENNFFNLPLHGPDLTQGRKRILIKFGGQFATLRANVAAIKYCCFDEIHTVGSKEILNRTISSTFFPFCFGSFPLLLSLLSFVCEWCRKFLFFKFTIRPWKTQELQAFCDYVGPYFLALLVLHMNSLAPNK
jgi:hypothetical protein